MANETMLSQVSALKESEMTTRTSQPQHPSHSTVTQNSTSTQSIQVKEKRRSLEQKKDTRITTGRSAGMGELNERNLSEIPNALSNLKTYLRANQEFERFALGEEVSRMGGLRMLKEWEAVWVFPGRGFSAF